MSRAWEAVELHLGDPYDDRADWGHIRRSALSSRWLWTANQRDGKQARLGEGQVETEADAREAVEHFLRSGR